MTNRSVYIRDYNTGVLIPLAYVDNGDGTFSRLVRTSADGLVTKIIYRIDPNSDDLIPVTLIRESDGSYATLISLQ